MDNKFLLKLSEITAYELIMVLVECTRKPSIPLNSKTYARVNPDGGIEANLVTNMIAAIGCTTFDAANIKLRHEVLGITWDQIRKLDHILYNLTLGLIDQYNLEADKFLLPRISTPISDSVIGFYIKAIQNGFTEEDIIAFEELAEFQIKNCRCAPRHLLQ